MYMSDLNLSSSDEKEIGEDEGPTKEVESEIQSEEQQQQQREEKEEEEELVKEEEEEEEQSHSAPCEAESQPS